MATKEIYEDDEFIISLTIEGTEFQEEEVKVTDPNRPIRDQITRMVSVFELSQNDEDGLPLQFLLGFIGNDGESEILEFEDEEGHEQTLLDYNIQSGDHLYLISVPIAGDTKHIQYDSEYIINLTIDGTEFQNEKVLVADPFKSIREQINSIISVFELPQTDCGGNPIQYLLGQIIDEDDEPEILEFEDEDGREQTIIDYKVQPGDHLCLISVPIAGYACPVPEEMEQEWQKYIIN